MSTNGTAERPRDGRVLLRVSNIDVDYDLGRRGSLRAVSDVSFEVEEGETLGLVGESGCGKSTTAKAVMMVTPPSAGQIEFDGESLTALGSRDLRRARRKFQMIFQDPISSLNSLRTVRSIVAEGLSINGVPKPWDERIDEVLTTVGLDPQAVGDRRPRELSGGQCQRVAIARAVVLRPKLIVCDEPVSALDVSVQAQILNLLEDMKAAYDLTLLFIAHDLAVVKNISDRVAVMYLGRICEVARSDDIYHRPQHPYTQALLSAVPEPEPSVGPPPPLLISGDLPSPMDPPSGCRFRTRCPRAEARCRDEEPAPVPIGPDHWVACHFPGPSSVSAVDLDLARGGPPS